MKLEEGIYEIPDDCTALYSKRKVIVKKKTRQNNAVLRCEHCIHQKWGRLTMKNQWWESPYCEKKPKTIRGKEGYFYNACSSNKACEMFEPKES